MRLANVPAGAAALLAMTTAPFARAQQEPPYGYHEHMWDSGWGMIFGPFAMLIFAAAIVIVVILIIRWLGGPTHFAHPGHQVPPPRGPLDILKERFARGEIDKAEFEERRRVLEQ